MTEWIWLGFVIVANLISLTFGQLPITPAGRQSQREIIKNQMRNVFQGRSGYIPILSYLRVRGGSISGASPGKANPQFSTVKPAGPVNGRTVDSGIQFRNGLNWIYMVPAKNGQIIDERRRLNIPFLTDSSTAPSGSVVVSPASTTRQNGPQNPANINPVTLSVPNGVLSLTPNGSVPNRSAITSSFDNVSTDSIVDITNNGTNPQVSGNISAKSPSVTLGNISHVPGQGAHPTVHEVEDSGGRIPVQGHSTNVYVDDRTGGGNVIERGDNSLVLASPDDVRLLENGEGHNNNNNYGVAPIDDLQTHKVTENNPAIRTNNTFSVLSSHVILDEANDLNKQYSNNTHAMLDDRQNGADHRVNNIISVLPTTNLNLDQDSKASFHNSKVNLSKQANTNETKPNLITSGPSSTEGTQQISEINPVTLKVPNDLSTGGVHTTPANLRTQVNKNEVKTSFIRNSLKVAKGTPYISEINRMTLKVPYNVSTKDSVLSVSPTTSPFDSANHLNTNNTRGIKSSYGGRQVSGDGFNYLGKGNTSFVAGKDQSATLQSDIRPDLGRTIPNNKHSINTAEKVGTVRPVDLTTMPAVASLDGVKYNNNQQKPDVFIENTNAVKNAEVQNRQSSHIISHVPVNTNNIAPKEQKQAILNVLPTVNVEFRNAQPKHYSSGLNGSVKKLNKAKLNHVETRKHVIVAATTVGPQRQLIQFQSTPNFLRKRPTQSPYNRQQLQRFLSRSFKPYPWAQARPQITSRASVPKSQGNPPFGNLEKVTQSLFTVRFINQYAPISQASPIYSQATPTAATLSSTNWITDSITSLPMTENLTVKTNVNSQPLLRGAIQKTNLPIIKSISPAIVQATPPSVYAVKQRPSLVPAIVQATPPSFYADVPDSLAGKQQKLKPRHPIPFSLDHERINNLYNKLRALVNSNITAQGSGNQVNGHILNSIADVIRSHTVAGINRIRQHTIAPVVTNPPSLRPTQPSRLQYNHINNDVNANPAITSNTLKTSMNADTIGSGPIGNSRLTNTAKGNIGTVVHPQTVNNVKLIPISNTGRNNGAADTIGRSANFRNTQETTVQLLNNQKPSNRTKIIDLRVDPMRLNKYRYLFRSPTFIYKGGNLEPQTTVPSAAVNYIATPPGASTQPNRVGENPRRLPVTVPFKNSTNVPPVQAGPIPTGPPNTPTVPATAFPTAYLSFTVNPSTFRERQVTLSNNSTGTKRPILQPAQNSAGGSKIETNVPKTSTNFGNGFVNTLFQDRGPPIAGSLTNRTIDVNPVTPRPQLNSLEPETPQLLNTTEPLFNSTFLVEAWDLFNLTESDFGNLTESDFGNLTESDFGNLTESDFSNLTIGISVLDFNETMMNDSLTDNITTTTDPITTTSLPTTTPFGSINALCGAHLVGHPDMPPHPTTTPSYYYPQYMTYAPNPYRFPWQNPLHPEYEPPEPSEAPEYGQAPAAPVSAAELPIGQCFCFEKAECEGIGATQGLPYEYMCDISAGLSCCCEPS